MEKAFNELNVFYKYSHWYYYTESRYYQSYLPASMHFLFVSILSCSMEKNSAPFVPYSYLFSNGFVFDEQPVKVISSCRLDIYTFPFDIQTCCLSFNSYLLSSKQNLIQILFFLEFTQYLRQYRLMCLFNLF